MPSALEDYMTRMGLGSSTTGSLGLDVPPPREVPKFTKFGDRMAALGGFGDQPGELKTLEELQKMSQEEIDEYKKERAKARGQGVAETLIRIGEAFQGKPASANALARQQQRQIIESQNLARQKFNEAYATANPSMRKLMDAFRGNESTWYEAKQKQAATALFAEPKEREIMEDVYGRPRYVDTQELVFPGVEYQPKESDVPVDIQKLDQLKKFREKLDPNSELYDPNYTPEMFNMDASILGVNQKFLTPSKESFISEYMKQMRGMKDLSGKPIFGDAELRDLAEKAYNSIYGEQPSKGNNGGDSEEIIDLGSL